MSRHRKNGRYSMGVKPKLLRVLTARGWMMLGASAAAFSVLTLAGCTPENSVVAVETTTESGVAAAVPSSTPVKGALDVKLPEGVYRYGDTVEYEDGSKLTVSKPVSFKPGEWASGGEGFADHVKVKITFVNGGGDIFYPSQSLGYMTSGDEEGEQVYDEKIKDSASSVLPGKKRTWEMGFGVGNGKKTTFQFEPAFLTDQTVYFTSE